MSRARRPVPRRKLLAVHSRLCVSSKPYCDFYKTCHKACAWLDFHIRRWKGWWWSYRREGCLASDHGSRLVSTLASLTLLAVSDATLERFPVPPCVLMNFKPKHDLPQILTLTLTLPKSNQTISTAEGLLPTFILVIGLVLAEVAYNLNLMWERDTNMVEINV